MSLLLRRLVSSRRVGRDALGEKSRHSREPAPESLLKGHRRKGWPSAVTRSLRATGKRKESASGGWRPGNVAPSRPSASGAGTSLA